MKYIIMCGGHYDEWETPKQLTKINGETLVERTIRLLRKNGVENIAISTNNSAFDYIDVEKLHHFNQYIHNNYTNEVKNSDYCWLNAYYTMDDPCCYLHGDVYFSEDAIRKIVSTEVDDTMFFCTFDKTDGETAPENVKGREPFAYKVQNQTVFRYAIKKIKKMVDDGLFEGHLAPISWHLYRFLNGYDVKCDATQYTEVNNIFQKPGDYVVINDCTVDIDTPGDIERLEKITKKEE